MPIPKIERLRVASVVITSTGGICVLSVDIGHLCWPFARGQVVPKVSYRELLKNAIYFLFRRAQVDVGLEVPDGGHGKARLARVDLTGVDIENHGAACGEDLT